MNDEFRAHPPLYLDILDSADAIGRFLWGRKFSRRRVYRAIQRGLPVFRTGRKIQARRSAVMAWIENQEKKAT